MRRPGAIIADRGERQGGPAEAADAEVSWLDRMVPDEVFTPDRLRSRRLTGSLDEATDREIAGRLNAQGHRTFVGLPFRPRMCANSTTTTG